MTQRITPKQCRACRALLKWNINDLTAHVSVIHKRIDSFEKGIIHLYQNENTEIMQVFQKQGIEFLSDFEVRLRKEKKQEDLPVFVGKVGMDIKPEEDSGSGTGEEGVIYVATDNYVGPDRRTMPRDPKNTDPQKPK
jgi:hypothetical protein